MTRVALSSPNARSAEEMASSRLWRRVFSQWYLVLGSMALVAVVAFIVSSVQTPQYEATTSIQLQETDLVSLFMAGSDTSGNTDSDPVRRAATNVELITLPGVREAASKRLGGRLTPEQLLKETSVSNGTNTDIFGVSVKDKNARLAAQAADATVAAFIQARVNASRATLAQATASVSEQYNALSASDKASSTGAALRDRLRQVGVVGALANGGVTVVQSARIAPNPVSPRPKRNAFLGLIIGLILGVGAAVIRARMDDRIRDPQELGDLWANLPVVGLVPETGDLNGAGRSLPLGPALEAFALARTNLRYLHVGGDLKTVVVTSALEGEGKSTVAWNLAVASGLAESRVLLIEADLRRPVLSGRLELTTSAGLSEVLADIAPVSEAIVSVEISDELRGVSATIDVLPAGMTPPSPVALLERHGLGDLLAELRDDYDLILIDTPPATIVADALVVLEQADSALIVSRLGRATSSAVSRLRDLMETTSTPVIGQIVNGGASTKAYEYVAYHSPTKRSSDSLAG